MCESISPEQFKELKVSPEAVVLDVRTPKERFEEGFITENLINFEDPDFSSQIEELDKDKIYLLYCKTGGRSKNACHVMRSKGFERVVDLDGGISRWKEIYS